MSKTTNEKVRGRYMEVIAQALAANGDEVLRVKANEYAVPCVDENGEDQFVVITIKVPTGTREGDPYDGYAEAEDYTRAQAAKAERNAKAAAAKAAKIERDKAAREAKAKAKAERNTNAGD